jgi:hypothetical protein
MPAQSKYFVAALASLGVMAGATVLVLADGQEAGWRITPNLSTTSVHFTIRRAGIFGNSIHSSNVPLEKFRGFSLSMLASPGPAKFEYVGDAGRLLCEGRFSMGSGSGAYTFAPDRAFAAELQQMGFGTPDDDQLFSMLAMNIGRDFARDIHDAGVPASARDLIRLRTHGVDLRYVHEALQAGYRNFSAEDYVQLRIHGAETDLLRELKTAGYDLRAAEIVDLTVHGVDSRFLRDLRSYGLQPAAADLTQLQTHGVTPEYLNGLKEAGYGHLSVDEIEQLQAHGVEPEFPREARRLGYDFTPDELAQLRAHGVDSGYLRHLQEAGMRNLSAEQISQLRSHGVD